MAKKTTTTFGVGIITSNDDKFSIFNRLIGEIDATEIPLSVIDIVLVQYCDGDVVELKSDELINSIPVNRASTWADMRNSIRQIRDIKIFLDNTKLESIVNPEVEKYLGKYC